MKQFLLILIVSLVSAVCKEFPQEDLKFISKAELSSELIMGKKEGIRLVKYHVLEDVVSEKTKQVVITKGSTLVGEINSRDIDMNTGVSKINFKQVYKGNQTIKVQNLSDLVVASLAGEVGIQGEIRDNQGKYLAGEIQVPYVSSLSEAENKIRGLALSSSAMVQKEIAQRERPSRSKNRVYYIPQGVKVLVMMK